MLFFAVPLEGMKGLKALAHLECLNKAQENQRDGDPHQKIELDGRNAPETADQRDQRARYGNKKKTE